MSQRNQGWSDRKALRIIVMTVLLTVALFSFASTAYAVDVTSAYYTSSNPFHRDGYGLPNCTCFAWGRAYEVFGTRPNLSTGNACSFWGYNINHGYYAYGQEPRAGSIACWNGTGEYDEITNPNGNNGHVAFVEDVSGDNVTISQSAWGWRKQSSPMYGTIWETKTINKNNMGSIQSNFQGYIYLGDVPQGTEMPSGYAQAVPNGDYIIMSAASSEKSYVYYLDIAGSDYPAANATNVILTKCGSSEPPEFDTWTLTYSDGFYSIMQKGTNMSLDVEGIKRYSGANVMVGNANGGSNQKFAIKHWNGNGYIIQAKHSGYAVSLAGSCSSDTNVCQSELSGADSQCWLLIPYQPQQPNIQGRFVFLDGVTGGFEIDLPGDTGELDNHTAIQLWDTGALSQYNAFDITPLSNGYFKIKHVASGKCLDVSNGLSSPSTKVGIYTDNGSITQQWAIIPTDGNRYKIISKCNGYPLDANAGEAFHNGTPVQSHHDNGGNNQKWYIAKAEYYISYNANGGTGAPGSQNKLFKQNLTLSSQVPKRDGYIFAGWGLTADDTTPSYLPGAAFTLDQDQTLYAVWTGAELSEIIVPEYLNVTVGNKVKLDISTKPAGMDLSELTFEFSNTACASIDNEHFIQATYVPGVHSTELTITAPNGVTATTTVLINGNVEGTWEAYINGQPINTTMTIDVYKVGQTVPYRVEYDVTNNYDPGYELELNSEYDYPLTINNSNKTITFTKGNILYPNLDNSMVFGLAGFYFGYGDILITDDQESMYLPNDMLIIGDEAFSGSKAKYFFLPNGVTEIGDNAFPQDSYVFLNTSRLSSYNFLENDVCFIETGSAYNSAFKDQHDFYRVQRGTKLPEIWSEWSDWGELAFEPTDTLQVETKTVYRYRDTTYRTEYSAWSDWGWYDTVRSTITDPEVMEEQSNRVYIWYWFTCVGCGGHSPRYGSGICPNCWADVSSDYHVVWLDINTSTSGTYSRTVSGTTRTAYNYPGLGEIYYNPGDNSGQNYTGYRYRTRTRNQVPVIGNWSEYQDTLPASSANREIENKVLYRYRTRIQ